MNRRRRRRLRQAVFRPRAYALAALGYDARMILRCERYRRRLPVLAAALLLPAAGPATAQHAPPRREIPAGPADAIYYNGKIVTMWAERPVVESMTVAGGRILDVGTTQTTGRKTGPRTRQIDLQGKTVVPGLIDSHVHPIGAALAESGGELPTMRNFADLQAHVERKLKTTAGMIVVPKVYSTRLAERRYPTRGEIDSYSGGRAVMFDNGYTAALNSAALRAAGVSAQTPDPENGKVIRNRDGEPTGLIIGARQLVAGLSAVTRHTHADRVRALRAMQKAYNRVGLTSVIDRSQNADGLRAYQTLWRDGELTVRSYVTRTVNAEQPLADALADIRNIGPVTGFGDDRLRIGSLKIFLDGGILLGTAYLRSPYGEHTGVYGYSDPDYRGVLRVPLEKIAAIVELAAERGWQMTAHTTGGGSTDALLTAYETVNRKHPLKDRRFTMTHANFPNGEAIRRAKALGVVLDMQPAWHHYDGPALSQVLGPERMAFFHPYKSLFDAGIVVAGGSDHMVKFDSREAINPYNPFFGMWMAVTRRAADGAVYNPEQKITREQALSMWTLNAAYLSFDEDVKGSLEPGKYADFAVIDRDILTCPEDEIRAIEVLETVLGGETAYRRQ